MLASTSLGIFANVFPDNRWTKSFPASGYSRNLPLYQDGAGNIYTLIPNPDDLSVAPGPVMKSTDEGNSWFADTAGLTSTINGIFYVDDLGVQHLGSAFYGPNYSAMLYKKDPGSRWVADTSGFPVAPNSSVVDFASDRHGMLYVTGLLSGRRVMRRPPGGGPWVVDTSGIPSTTGYFVHMTSDTNGSMIGAAGPLLYRHVGGVWKLMNSPGGGIAAICVDARGTLWTVCYESVSGEEQFVGI